MDQKHKYQFKTLLTFDEYNKLIKRFKGFASDVQTNHYFDTNRFSLKALGSSLRVRDKEGLELTLKRKKKYMVQDTTIDIDQDFFDELKETGILPECEVKGPLGTMIGDQKLVNYISLSTSRIYLSYKNGIVLIDKSKYLDVVDYELSYLVSNYKEGKSEFIQLINELDIVYTKSEKKIKRAMNAYKRYVSN